MALLNKRDNATTQLDRMRLAHAGSPFNRIESPIQQIGNPESGRERHALGAQVIFVIDACDREIIAWSAVANAGISGEWSVT
ncbi:MAG: hypothetical protein KJ843_15610 [Alphaproteobacteria bacterium]|nr:hypothetical protein [Alphaproteobacteria bacterium]MBU2366714.1 hypothetical protein [Alphaproteobacteria bacterium]